MKLVRGLSFSALLVAAQACSPPPPEMDGGIVLTDVGVPLVDSARPDGGPPLEVVTLVVNDNTGTIVGAAVSIDDANGDRHTGITGTGGRVMVPHVAWGTGRISITAAAAHHPVRTLAGYRHADLGSHVDGTGAITLTLSTYYTPIGLSGHVLNSADTARPVRLRLSVSGDLTVTGTSFAGELVRNVPFRLFAIDSIYTELSNYHYTDTPVAFVQVDHAALTSAGSIDVDMSATVPLTTISGSFPLPADGNPAQSGVPGIEVSTDESYGDAWLGYATEMAISADGATFDFSVAQVATTDATAPITYYYTQTRDLFSQIMFDGMATAHAITTPSQWPVPPTFVTPAGGTTASLHDPIELTGVDAAMPTTLTVASDYNIWFVEMPPGTTSLTIPQPPDGTDMTTWTSLRVTLRACEPWPGHHFGCHRSAGGDSFAATL